MVPSLPGLLVSTVAPPLAVAGLGYVLGRWRSVETEGLNAVVFVVVQNVLIYTLGVFVVSRSADAGSRGALSRVFSLPLVYAVAAAGLALALDVVPPADGVFMRTVGMVGDAAIPLFLLILGLQLAGMRSTATAGKVAPAAGLKLLVAPLVAGGVALGVGLGTPSVTGAFVLLAAGPAAVLPLVLFVEFDGHGSVGADRYATAVVVTLLGSVPVVAAVLAVLRAGPLG